MAYAYIIPFVLYLLGTSFIGRFGDAWYPISYSVVVSVTALTTYVLIRGKQLFRPHWRVVPAVIFGLVGIVLWIVICQVGFERWVGEYMPSFLRPEERASYNPFEELGSGLAVYCFIGVRLLGIAILVPVAEELFWRGFLLRWLIDPEWEKVPVGEYSFSSCAIVTLMFTLAHPEWLAAATYCLLMNGLFYWKRDLWLCIVAHAVSNLALAVYVMCVGAWWLW